MQRIKRAILFILLAVTLFSATSCGLVYIPNDDEEAFEAMLTELFAALDNGDEAAVYELFAPAVRESCEDLKAQVDTLLTLYPSPTDEFYFDGMVNTTESINADGQGGVVKETCTTIPTRSGEEYYWFFIELMFKNTLDEDQVGIRTMEFYTADERCMYLYDENTQYEERDGLYIHAQNTLDCEVRTIFGSPHKYTRVDRTIDLDDVVAFLEASDSYAAFVKKFGDPNAERIYHYYELPSENGKPRYLCLGVDDRYGTVYAAKIVDNYEYIKMVWEEGKSS